MKRARKMVGYSKNSLNTRSIVYKGWLIRDEIHRLVEYEIWLRDSDYSF